jgi:phosphohistidine swiveling domain-containing protein
MLRSMPGIRGRTVGELFGGQHGHSAELSELDIPEQDIPDLRINRFRTALKAVRLAGRFLTHTPRRGELYAIRLGEETEAMRRSTWRSLSDAALAKRMQEVVHSIAACTHGFVFAAIGLLYGLGFFNLCERWLGDGTTAEAEAGSASGGAFGSTSGGGGRSVASRLLAGLGSLDNAEAGLALWRLARLAHEHPEVRQQVLSNERFEALRPRLAATEGGRAFLEGWESFLWCHGHHTRGEVELANARWSETPDYVLQLLQSHLSGVAEVDPIARSRQLAEERARLAAECRWRLRNPIKRFCFSFMLKRAQDGAPLRENLKSEYVRRGTLVRAMLLELGGRLAARGALDETDDIFFLRLPEVEPLVRGEAGFDVRATVGPRRAEYERNLTLDPPPVVVGPFDPQRHTARPVEAGTDRLEGLAVSPGVVTGRARVILRAGTDRVAPGEVLVAPFTDPGWTPYFLNAAGIVMDMGGLLSHGSIIAREYGIPCVVNVGPATKIIDTGAMVEVDGDRGVVRVLG